MSMATKSKFRTKYVKEPYKSSPTGKKIQIEHSMHINLNGVRYLKPDVEKPIYEMIQAHRESTEIERIVKRALNGDMSVLNAMEGQYLDITGAPESLAHAQQIIINAKKEFEKLDLSTRAKFDNNPEIFVAQAGSEEWIEKMGLTKEIEARREANKKQAEFNSNLEEAVANLAKGNKGGETE